MKKLKKVLLVDDDFINNYLNELLLQEMDITEDIMIASNGEEALNYVEQTCKSIHDCPELILLDINMPIMNGLEFLEAFATRQKDIYNHTSVVMLTSSSDDKDIEQATKFNIKGYLSKPLTEEKLNLIIDKFILK